MPYNVCSSMTFAIYANFIIYLFAAVNYVVAYNFKSLTPDRKVQLRKAPAPGYIYYLENQHSICLED